MDIRSMLDQVKAAFVIGKGNSFLHGRQGQRPEQEGYGTEGDYAPQPPYQLAYQQPAYQQPYQQQAEPYQQQVYQQPQQAAYPQQAYQAPQPQAYQQAYQPPVYQQPAYQQPAYQTAPQAPEPPEHSFQTQISPEPIRESGRSRRSQQHQEQAQPSYQQPAQPPENVVPFPGSHVAPSQVDAYVINVFNIGSCRQAMSCLRKGQCTLVVMDQLMDKSEIRRFVDMLTGACYALNGTMTRLSSKIGFYIMAPSTMTVYTDPTTSNANAPRPQAQQPIYRAPTAPGSLPQRPQGGFAQQSAYAQPPQMSFTRSEAQAQEQAPRQEDYQQAAEAYTPYPEQAYPQYQAQ